MKSLNAVLLLTWLAVVYHCGLPAQSPAVDARASEAPPDSPAAPAGADTFQLQPITLGPVDITRDLSVGLHRYTILFFTDDSVASYQAFERAMALCKSHWHIVAVPITHPLADKFGYTAAPQFVALLDGEQVGCSDGATHADLYAMLTLAYAPQYAAAEAARQEAFEASAAAKETWSLASLKAWLAKYATNPHRTTTGVAGRTVFHHLTDPADPHKYPAALVSGLTAREQQLLHDADHDGLSAPDGPLADPLTKPAAKKAPVTKLPAVRQPYCPNCVRPQMRWGW